MHARLSAGEEATAAMQQLAPAIVTVWRIKTGLWAAGIALIALFYDVLELLSGEALLPFGLITALVVVSGAALTIVAPRLIYRRWRYALLEDELHVQYGVLNHVYTIVPLHRIQHMDVSQDIIEREHDLARLIVHTAGTRNSEVVVPGLRLEKAESLRDRLNAYVHTVRT